MLEVRALPRAKHNPSRGNLPGGPRGGRDYFSRSDRIGAGPRAEMLPRRAAKRGYTFLTLPWKIFSLSSLRQGRGAPAIQWAYPQATAQPLLMGCPAA